MTTLRVMIATALAVAWSAAQGATHHVYPGESIQAAIDAAAAGDEIVVHAGSYVGAIDFRGRAVTLRSADGAAATILDGQQAGPVIRCHSGEGPGTVLDGFLITGGRTTGNGGGMLIQGASPRVLNCTFRANQAQYGGGVFAQASQPALLGCAFDANTADASGGAIYVYGVPGAPAPDIVDCRFSSNTAGSVGGAVRIWDSSPALARCVFIGNHARFSGGGLAIGGASAPSLTDCRFDGNRADTLFGNWDSAGGGAVVSESSQPEFVNCVFVANSAVALYPRLSRGGALAGTGAAQPRLVNCSLASNHANIGHALSNTGSAAATVVGTILWNGGDEIANEGTGADSVSYSDVAGGWPGLGNIAADPRWNDLRLPPDSPCRDAGDPAYAPPGGRDLDGHARVLGGRVDMGAYESGIGDYDADHDVDSVDFSVGFACLTGPDNGPYSPGCEALDFEYDGDVDLLDVAAFQLLLGP